MLTAERMSSKTWTLIAAVLGSSIVFLDSAVLTVALPAIGNEPACSSTSSRRRTTSSTATC